MLFLIKAEQFSLFSAPVHVAASVRKDGTVVAPHTRIQKVRVKPHHTAQPSLFDDGHKPVTPHTPDMFEQEEVKAPEPVIAEKVEKPAPVVAAPVEQAPAPTLERVLQNYGGRDGVRKILMTAPMREASKMLGLLSKLSGKTLDEVTNEYGGDTKPEPVAIKEPEPVVVEKTVSASDPFGVPAGISKTRRREINAQAADLINSGAPITDSGKALLRQYSGNGGCGDSLNEFYTDPDVATAMWSVLGRLGVGSGTVCEPSCATGVFLHTAPQGIRVTGVEMDPTSAAIAEALHGDRHEVINSSLERFATTDGTRQFDAVIGNAPFGIRGSLVKDDKSELKTAEGYFLDTSLDKCKPGGIVAMIVPTGVLDSKSARQVRQRLLTKGEFLGAMRMPNTAFEHSHTEVTTDVVFFRKRPDDVAGALAVLDKNQLQDLGVWDDEYLSGGYFAGRGAENIFGTMEDGWRAKAGIGQDITVSGSMAGVPESIAGWVPDDFKTATPDVPTILASVGEDMRAKVKGAAMKRPYELARAGDTKTEDGVTYILQGKPLRWHRMDEFTQAPDVTAAQGLARDIESAINGGSREGLADRVRAYIDAYGSPAKNQNLLVAASQDRVLYRLIGAVGADGTLSDIVSDRASRKVEGSLDIAAQSLSVEHETGTFTVAQLAERMDKPEDELEDVLFASSSYAYVGDGQWTPMEAYVTGELWPKLDHLKAELERGELREGLAEKYSLQVKRLEDAIDAKSLEDVDISINSAFLPLEVLEQFFNDRNAASPHQWVKSSIPVKISFANSWYKVEGGVAHEMKLVDNYLNRDGVKKDELPAVQALNDEFKDWLLGSRYRDQVEEMYNRKFRGFVQAEYSDAPILIPGMNTDGLKQYQYSGLRWALAAKRGIIAADVGLGKTVRGLMLARMAKINGTAKRPTFVVPKSVLANWVAEAEKWFPGSRVLVVGETYTRDKAGNLKSKTDTAAERNRKLHDMTQNDYDFVFISQPSFNDIDLDPIIKGQYVNDDFWVQRGDAKGNLGDKRLNKIRQAYEQAVANREFQKRTDAIYWDDLGIDMMLVDEGHAYKNLYAAKNRFGETPKFLGGQGQSNRAFDMNMKTRYLREHNGGNGVFMLTATPTKNSPLEIYSMLSHVAPEAFERIGIRNSEEFLDRFCVFVEDKVLSTSGGIEDALVTSGFKNLGELREIMRRYIDRKTAADVGLVMPGRDDQMHLVDMTDEQQSVYAKLRQDMIDSAKTKDATGDSHIFSIMDKMGKAAMDLELLDPVAHAGERSPKYDDAAARIVAGAKEGGQVVFAESVASHRKMMEALVKAGIPVDRIAIINAQEAESSSKRQNIADAFNAGKLDVVIGNTATMGEGINLQKRTTDIHHLDLPWDPASMQQRNGRGLRQGNTNASVRLHTYLAKGSFDGYRYQSMMAKKDWQDMLWNGGDNVENLARAGKFDRSDLLIMMSADPEAERAKFESDKAAATQRYEGEKRKEVAVEFKRLQLMKQSYGALKNKNTSSAVRLLSQLERAKTSLANNKYFSAKGALNSKLPVVMHPETGDALQSGTGLDITEADGTAGKWVVTSVIPTTGDVSMRRYGEFGKRIVTVPVEKLTGGVKTFNYVETDEHAVIGEKLKAINDEKVHEVTDIKSLRNLPGSVIEANYPALQERLKSGLKDYSLTAENLGFVTADKQALTGERYESYKYATEHDLMLPTDEHRKLAIDAYIADEQAKRFTHDTVTTRRNSRPNQVFVQRMPGRFDNKVNRWHATGNNIFGEGFQKEAHSAFERVQGERVRRAPDFQTALREAAPMASVKYSGAPTWPRRTLAILFAKAKHDGILDKKWSEVQPKDEKYGRETNALPNDLWKFHDGTYLTDASAGGFSQHQQTSGTVRDTLTKLANGNGHKDLAIAMTLAAANKNNHGEIAGKLLNTPLSQEGVVESLTHLVTKYPDLGDFTLRELGMSNYRQNSHINNSQLDKKLSEMMPVFIKDAV